MSAISREISCRIPMWDESRELIAIQRRHLYWGNFLPLTTEYDLQFYLGGFNPRIKAFITKHQHIARNLRQGLTWFLIAMNLVHIFVIHPGGMYIYWEDKNVVIDNFSIINIRMIIIISVCVVVVQQESLDNIFLAMERLEKRLYVYNEDVLKKLRFVFKFMTVFIKCMQYICWPISITLFIHYYLTDCLPNRIHWFRGWYPFDVIASPTYEIMLIMNIVEVIVDMGACCTLTPPLILALLLIYLQLTVLKNNTEIISEIATDKCSSPPGDLNQFTAQTHPDVMSSRTLFVSRFVPERCGDIEIVDLEVGVPGYNQDGSDEGLPPIEEHTATNITQVHGYGEHHIITITTADDQGGSSEELCISPLSQHEVTSTNITLSQRNRFRSVANHIIRRNGGDVQGSENNYMNVLENLLMTYVQQHSQVIWIGKLVNKYLRFISLYTFFYNMIIFAALFMILQTETVPIGKKISYTNACVYSGCTLLALCVIADKIVDQSEGMVEALYFSDWLDTSPRYKKAMLIIMLQANKPVLFKADGFSPFSLNFFGEIADAVYKLITNASSIVTLN